MKQKVFLKRAAAVLLSSTMLVSLPVTAQAVTVSDNGEYEIVFNNGGGTIDGLTEAKTVRFSFDSNDETVDLTDLVGDDVKFSYYALNGWRLSGSDDVVTSVTKDDFGTNHSLRLYADFNYNEVRDESLYYIELDFGTGHNDEYELTNGCYVYLEFPKSQFTEFNLPIPVPENGAEFMGWLGGGYYSHNNSNSRPKYETITVDDFDSRGAINVHAVYKKLASPNDSSGVITLDANGGTIDGAEKESIVKCVKYDSNPQDISLFVPVIDDPVLRFAGWNTQKDGKGYNISHTGFTDEEPEDEDSPGWCDVFEYFGDEDGNITLYARWVKDPVRAETDSDLDKMIAAKAVEELEKYSINQYNVFYNDEDLANTILSASDAGKDVTIGFVMEEDNSDRAKENISKLKESWEINKTDVVSDKAYKINFVIKADGEEICRTSNIGILLNSVEIDIPDGMFDPDSRDTKAGTLYGVSQTGNEGYLSTGSFEGKIEGNKFYAEFSPRYREYENFIFVGKSKVNIKPHTDDPADEVAVYNAVYYATNYRGDPGRFDYYSDEEKAEIEAILSAYNSGKTITARSVAEKVTPTEQQKNDIVSVLDGVYKSFKPVAYYRFAQEIYADGKFLTSLSDVYNGLKYDLDIPEISSIPANTDPRYSNKLVFLTAKKSEYDDSYNLEKIVPYDIDGTHISGSVYSAIGNVYAFGYYESGQYAVTFGNEWESIVIDGVYYDRGPSMEFNFLSDDEELDIKEFFGFEAASDPAKPYSAFLGWQTSYYDYFTGDYVTKNVTSVSKSTFDGDTRINIHPKFDETIPKNSGTYYISLVTKKGKINDLPTLGGKITWKEVPDKSYGRDFYIGTVKSSDFTSITLPEPADKEKGWVFVGWNTKFDNESGTLKSHSNTITKADFSESDVLDLEAVYKYPADTDENLRSTAILNGNGGLVDGKEIGYYHAAIATSMEEYTFNYVVPVRKGYKFIGWNSKADGSGEMVDNIGMGSMSIFSKYHEPLLCDDDFNVTLYAQWELTGTPVESVKLDKSELTLEIGASASLTATITPDDAANKTLSWTSSDESVAAVKDGVVTATGNGTASITASAHNGIKAVCTVTVNTLINKSSVSSDEIDLGDSLTIKGDAEGGTSPYKYAFYYRRKGNTSWKTIGTEYGTATSASFKPTAESEYEIRVIVKDSKNKTAQKIMTIKAVNVPELVNASALSASEIMLGQSFVITGKAEGGRAPYTYSYYYKRSANTKWNKIGSENTSETSASFKPSAVADFDIKTVVTDSKGKTAEEIFSCTVQDPNALKNTSVINSDKVQIGDKVRVSASASGGTAPYQYAYYYKRSTNTTWKTLGTEFGTTSSVSFAPTAEADFDVKVIVRDSKGTTAEKLFTVKAVKELELTNVSVLQRTSVKLGTAIPMIGKAVGGTAPYTYAFYFKRSTNSTWKLLGDKFGEATTARLKPTAKASYDIRIIVKDCTGATSEKRFTAEVK